MLQLHGWASHSQERLLTLNLSPIRHDEENANHGASDHSPIMARTSRRAAPRPECQRRDGDRARPQPQPRAGGVVDAERLEDFRVCSSFLASRLMPSPPGVPFGASFPFWEKRSRTWLPTRQSPSVCMANLVRPRRRRHPQTEAGRSDRSPWRSGNSQGKRRRTAAQERKEPRSLRRGQRKLEKTRSTKWIEGGRTN